MAIGSIHNTVISVDDLAVAEAFWSEVTGLTVLHSAWAGRYSSLGETSPAREHLGLRLVTTTKGPDANRAHVDIKVENVDRAIVQVEAIGGRLKKAPSIFPRPGSHPGLKPEIDWAVMVDPFGNEFCLIRWLSADEIRAIEEAAAPDDVDVDQYWRAVAHAAAP
ncbi:MAG TPA: VOC family protein [Micromonosporaceae bacterium]|jgi:catechol 2,3-dioxygenase-like lactoylglutathione lyase family enzyme